METRRRRFTVRLIMLVMLWIGVGLSTWHVLDGAFFVIWLIVVGLAMSATLPR